MVPQISAAVQVLTMANHSDLSFITNEQDRSLLERFKILIRETEFFDVLVGYFYSSGFHALYKSLESTKKIRILVGIRVDKKIVDRVENAKQEEFQLSHAEVKNQFSKKIVQEMNNSSDSQEVYEGVIKFMEWLRSEKLEIKAYPSGTLHAKLYIMSFSEGDRDKGRVITGSSNFTKSGLTDNLEFNVELKNRSDYEFALQKFNSLWEEAVDLKEKYIETIQKKTWLNDTITPYELYLKFLYEYFQEELTLADDDLLSYTPQGFKQLEYQAQAVQNAKRILMEYGGVFLSDVVGLGKTYMSALLARRLDGRSLVLASPLLLDESNPGSWKNVFSDFRVSAGFESLGKLDKIISRGTTQYKNIFIDEAHRFRRETTVTYEKLAQICRGKRVILVTATPFNNTPSDILSQIKLFQSAKKSSIPNVANLDLFFGNLERRLKDLNKKENHAEYTQIVRDNAKRIRESVLKYLMVRRTRTEIENYFAEDLKNQNIKFPEIKDPKPLFYQLNEKENKIFHQTAEFIGKKFKYTRYKPLTYYKHQDRLDQVEVQSQTNLGVFMKILLVKRLDSSFHAFQNSIRRFIKSYELFLKEFKAGHVYISKDFANKVFELLENEDEETVQKLLNADKVKKYPAEDFNEKLEEDLESDLKILKEIQVLWNEVQRDPKFLTLEEELYKNPVLKTGKLILFTESKETAEYLGEELSKKFSNKVLVFTGSSPVRVRDSIIENFDPKALKPKNDYKILIATEVLSEGVNLHRSNVVVNYDIPWNPTRLRQRVGRINRVDTQFDKIYTFNFFPTEQSNDIIKLKETAQAKVEVFINLLGTDAKLLTEEEAPVSHRLFQKLSSKNTIIGEGEIESDLRYLKIIKDIRDKNPDLFEKIKQLPKKARTAKKVKVKENQLLTYFKKGRLNKFCITGNEQSEELDFISAAKWLVADNNTPKESLPNDFYDKLNKNKEQFLFLTTEEDREAFSLQSGGGRDSSTQLLKMLKAVSRDLRQFTEDQEAYIKLIMRRLEEGALPKQTVQAALKAVQKELKSNNNGQSQSLRVLTVLQRCIPDDLLKRHISQSFTATEGPREVILSEYLIGN